MNFVWVIKHIDISFRNYCAVIANMGEKIKIGIYCQNSDYTYSIIFIKQNI